MCCQTQQTDTSYKPHPQLHDILDAIHNDLPKKKKKILYIACAAKSVNVNPIVDLKWLLFEEQTLNLNTKALLKLK